MPNERTRAYIYRVVTAVIPLLIILGVVSNEVAGAVLGIAAAVLAVGSTGLASANTTTKPQE